MANIPDDTFAPEVRAETSGSVLIITADGVEDIEFFYPYYRFIEAGYKVDVATVGGEPFKGKNGYTFKKTRKLESLDVNDYQLLFIPGGKAPEALKKSPDVIALVQEFTATGRPVAAICHGPQLLAAADLIRERDIAGWPEIESEITQAGGVFVNQQAVTDGQFTTARWPADLPAFMAQTLDQLSGGIPPVRQASEAPSLAIGDSLA